MPAKRKKENEQKPKKKQKKEKSANEFWNKDTDEWSEKVPFIREIQAHRKNVPKYNWFPVETFKSKEEWKTEDNLAKLCAENAPKLKGADIGFAKINPAKKLTKKQLEAKDASPDEGANSGVRLRLKLTHEQKQKFNLWLRATRITYNLCLELREQPHMLPKKTKIVQKKDKNGEVVESETKEVSLSWDTHMRKHCVNENGTLFEHNTKLKWLLEVPADVRGDVTRDLNKAYKTNFDKLKKAKVEGKDTTKFTMKKRNAFLDEQQSFSVTARNYNCENSKMYGWLKELKCQKWHKRFAEQLGVDDGRDELIPQSTNFMLRFVRERTGEYYVCFPTALPTKQQPDPDTNRIISLDPGVRTFMTGYDPSGTILEWGGKNCIKRTYNLKLKAKSLRAQVNQLKLTPKAEDEEKRENFIVKRFKRNKRSRGTKAARKTSRRKRLKRIREARHKRQSRSFRNKRKRYWIRKQALKVELKVKNMIADCHNKLVSHLCNTSSTILLPRFDTKNMAEKRDAETGLWKRRINPKTAENMLTWSHYKFRAKLLAKARVYEGKVKIVVCDEHYTSKTCGNCGEIHHKLGGNKTFTCPTCLWSADRDQQAARNILLRFLTLHVS